MDRLAIAAALVVVVVAVATILGRRRPEAPTQSRTWPVPTQLDRADFTTPAAPWLAVVFTSSTCEGCARVKAIVEAMASPQLAVQIVPWQDDKPLHERYGIEAVPCTVVADADGVVKVGFVGSTVSATDIWAAVAEAREPGSTPESTTLDPTHPQ